MYDLAIVGAGPAGLTASIYASRYGIKNVVIGGVTGGLTTASHAIGNWPGVESTGGIELAQAFSNHAKSYNPTMIERMVVKIEKSAAGFNLALNDGMTIEAKTVLLAMGTVHRHLGIKGEKELAGKGVSYCATCDGFFFRKKTVAVIGGSDSAAGAAVYLADLADKVYLIHRGDKLRAESFWTKAIEANLKIEIIYQTNLTEIVGEQKVEEVILDKPHQGSDHLKLNGVFIEIGSDPNVDLAHDLEVEKTDGYIKINDDGSTNVPGVWSAGDITTGSNKFKQIVTAAAEGAVAVASINKYLKS